MLKQVAVIGLLFASLTAHASKDVCVVGYGAEDMRLGISLNVEKSTLAEDNRGEAIIKTKDGTVLVEFARSASFGRDEKIVLQNGRSMSVFVRDAKLKDKSGNGKLLVSAGFNMPGGGNLSLSDSTGMPYFIQCLTTK